MKKAFVKLTAIISMTSMMLCSCSQVGALSPEEQTHYNKMQEAYNKMNYNIDISAYRTTIEYIISNSAMISADISKDCVKYPLIAETAITQMFETALATENTLGLYDVSSEDYMQQEAKPDEDLSLGIDSLLAGDDLSDIGNAVNQDAGTSENEETTSENEVENTEESTDTEIAEDDAEVEVKPSMEATTAPNPNDNTGNKGTGLKNPDGTEPGEFGYSPLPEQGKTITDEEKQAQADAYVKKTLEEAGMAKDGAEEEELLDNIEEDAKTDVLDKLEDKDKEEANPDDLQIDKPEIADEVKTEEKPVSKGNYPIYDENLYIVDYGSKEQSMASYQAFLNKPINALLSIEGYKNILVVKVDSKLNGKYMMKLDLDDSGKIVKITKFF